MQTEYEFTTVGSSAPLWHGYSSPYTLWVNGNNMKADDGSDATTPGVVGGNLVMGGSLVYGLSKISGTDIPAGGVITKVEMYGEMRTNVVANPFAAGSEELWVTKHNGKTAYPDTGEESSGAFGLTGVNIVSSPYTTSLGYTSYSIGWGDITNQLLAADSLPWTKTKLDAAKWCVKALSAGMCVKSCVIYTYACLDYIKLRVTWFPEGFRDDLFFQTRM